MKEKTQLYFCSPFCAFVASYWV